MGSRMGEGTYEDGYCDGWEAVAGEAPVPEPLTYPPEGEARDYRAGFRYGKSEAALRFKPGTGRTPPEPMGL